MDGEDVEGFQRHRVVTAEHVLIPQQVRQICRKRPPNTIILLLADHSRATLQTQKLPAIKHLRILPVTPPMEPVSFIAAWNRILRDIPRLQFASQVIGFCQRCKISPVGLLKESPYVLGFAFSAVVLDSEYTVARWARVGRWIFQQGVATGATALVPSRGPGVREKRLTRAALAWVAAVLAFRQFPTLRTDKNVPGVPPILGEEVAWKQIHIHLAVSTLLRLDP
jgi:hypothetical protein